MMVERAMMIGEWLTVEWILGTVWSMKERTAEVAEGARRKGRGMNRQEAKGGKFVGDEISLGC